MISAPEMPCFYVFFVYAFCILFKFLLTISISCGIIIKRAYILLLYLTHVWELKLSEVGTSDLSALIVSYPCVGIETKTGASPKAPFSNLYLTHVWELKRCPSNTRRIANILYLTHVWELNLCIYIASTALNC